MCILITGVGSDRAIGVHIKERLAAEYLNVVPHFRRSPSVSVAHQDTFVTGDFLDTNEFRILLNSVRSLKPNCIVHNAAILHNANGENTSTITQDDVLWVNSVAPYVLSTCDSIRTVILLSTPVISIGDKIKGAELYKRSKEWAEQLLTDCLNPRRRIGIIYPPLTNTVGISALGPEFLKKAEEARGYSALAPEAVGYAIGGIVLDIIRKKDKHSTSYAFLAPDLSTRWQDVPLSDYR